MSDSPADAGPRERHDARSALGETLTSEAIPSRTTRFAGEPHCVTGARLAAEEFLCDLGESVPPASPEHWDDILLVVTELAANAVQYAPGPFALRMRRTFDGVHVTLRDTNPTPPAPAPSTPARAAVASAGI